MKETAYKYFTVVPLPQDPNRKTGEYCIVNKTQGLRLGVIKWFGRWRQYCFFPEPFDETVWSAGCLEAIQDFLSKLKEERRRDARSLPG